MAAKKYIFKYNNITVVMSFEEITGDKFILNLQQSGKSIFIIDDNKFNLIHKNVKLNAFK